MAQIANIVINNGTADVTFTPMSKDGLDVKWSKPDVSADLNKRIQLVGYPVKSGTNRKQDVRIQYPFSYTNPNGVVSTKTITLKATLSAPLEATVTDLTIVRNLFSNLLKNAIIEDAIDNGNQPY